MNQLFQVVISSLTFVFRMRRGLVLSQEGLVIPRNFCYISGISLCKSFFIAILSVALLNLDINLYLDLLSMKSFVHRVE
jgi:hypothetical protein